MWPGFVNGICNSFQGQTKAQRKWQAGKKSLDLDIRRAWEIPAGIHSSGVDFGYGVTAAPKIWQH